METVLVDEDELELLELGLDVVSIRSVCHNPHRRTKRFVNLGRMLKTTARVAIIEYHLGGRFSLHRVFGHSVPSEVIEEIMRK